MVPTWRLSSIVVPLIILLSLPAGTARTAFPAAPSPTVDRVNSSPFPTSRMKKDRQRKALYNLLGKLPDRHRPLSVVIVSTQETDELITEKLLMDINGLEKVPAYFTRPKHYTGKLPVVLFNHSHFGQYEVGKEEFVQGRKEMQKPPYALALARAGYAGLCLDSKFFWGGKSARSR